MLARLVGSGALNPAVWVAVAALLYSTLFRSLHVTRRTSLVVVIGLAVCGGLSLAAGLYRSYAVPRDVLQDIIAAREYLAGRSMNPENMNALAREALAAEGPRASLLGHWPDAARREHEQFEEMLREHWVQAHPPLMTLAIAPLVAAFGVLGTQVAIAVLSALALGITLWLLMRELWPEGGTLAHAAVVFAVLGWAPVVGVFRLQQPGLILVALLTGAWACLRRGRGRFAGVAVAVAAGLKLVPGLLAFPLIVRHRRAAVALVATAGLLLAGILALVPLADIRAYHATTSGVIDEYAAYPSMISLLGVYARWGKQFGFSPGAAEGLWLVTLTAVVGGWACLLLRRSRLRPDPRREIDYEFAVGMSLIPWLSPIAWDHYEVFLLLPLAVLAGHVFRQPQSRRSRVWFGLLLVAIAVPDGLFLDAFDFCRTAGYRPLQVWVLEPLRAFVGIALTAWLVRAWLGEPRVAA